MTREDSGAFDHATAWVAEWQKLGIGALVCASPACLTRLNEMNAEIVRFAGESMYRNMQLGAALADCTDPVAFREVQGHYLKAVFEACCAEMGKLVRMSQDALDQAAGRRSGG